MKGGFQKLSGVFSAALCLLLLLGLLDSVILSRINAPEMAGLFEEYAKPPEGKNLDYGEIAGQLIRYLQSGDDRLLPRDGETHWFSEKENLHLKDCAGIIIAMIRFRTVFLVALALTLLLLVALYRRFGREMVTDGMLGALKKACLVLALFALALTVWGLIDFDSLFLTFHHVFFNNRLWLLNPEKDLLIQLMPEPFFRAYAGRILLSAAPLILLMAALPFLARANGKRR